jgi:WD40 repeat protein
MMPAPQGRLCETVDDALDPMTCQALIRAAEGRGFQDASPAYPSSYRDNDRQLLDDPGLAQTLLKALRHLLPQTLDGEVLVGLNPRFRICRYRPGQQFTLHQDGAWHPDSQTRSRLTLMLYLNDADNFSGGMTRFYEQPGGDPWVEVRPRTGRLMLFDHLLWHDGQRIEEGTKYILRTDVLYESAQASSGHLGYVWTALALPDGRLATGGRDQTIRIWRDGQCEETRKGHELSVLTLTSDARGQLWSGSRDGTIVAWSKEGQAVAEHRTEEGAVLCLAAQGDDLFSGGADGMVRRWPDGVCVARHRGWVRALAVGEGAVFSGGADGIVMKDGVEQWALGSAVWCLLFQGGELYAGCEDGRIHALRAGRQWQGHRAGVRALAWHGGRLVSGGEDAVVRSWGGAGGEQSVGGFVSGLASAGGRLWCAGYAGLSVVSGLPL